MIFEVLLSALIKSDVAVTSGIKVPLKEWKRLFVNDCECKNLITLATECLNSCQIGAYAFLCPEVMSKYWYWCTVDWAVQIFNEL